jgi:AbrB family looped-hinge helix DNA binding protein
MPKMTSKGQVTIPKRFRDRLGLRPGSEVEFAENEAGDVLVKRPKLEPRKSRFAALRGTLKPGMSGDELMQLTRGWGEPDRGGR